MNNRGGNRKGAGRPKKQPTKVLSYRVVETNAKEIDQKIKELIGIGGTIIMEAKWSKKEIQMLMGYIESSDEETISKRLDFARYMLHSESGFIFPYRSLSAVTAKFYKEIKQKR